MHKPDGETEVQLRAIRPTDDAAVAALIRDVMTEFGLVGEGFAIADPEVAHMSAVYRGGNARYFVLLRGEEVLGGGGFGPLAGMAAESRICELRKMYLRPELRGLGQGRRLLAHLLAEMRAAGYRACYLETTSRMTAARSLYTAFGFRELEGPMGSTGHGGCNRFYLLDL